MGQNLTIFVFEVKLWSYILLFAELLNSTVFIFFDSVFVNTKLLRDSAKGQFCSLEEDPVSFSPTKPVRIGSRRQVTIPETRLPVCCLH